MLRPKHKDDTSYIFRYQNCHSLHTCTWTALPHGSKMLSATLVMRTSNTVHMSKKQPFVTNEDSS